jgi:hypothetical protein
VHFNKTVANILALGCIGARMFEVCKTKPNLKLTRKLRKNCAGNERTWRMTETRNSYVDSRNGNFNCSLQKIDEKAD